VLEVTAAANTCHRARRRDASRGCFEHLLDNAAPSFSPNSRQSGANSFAFDATGDEVGRPGAMRETVSARDDPFNRRFRVLWHYFFDCL
jgi:hypothetical protein